MRVLKIAVIVMGVLIVAGTAGLIFAVLRRHQAQGPLAGGPLPAVIGAVLQEPQGTRIATIAGVGGRLAVQLQGGGMDRVVLVDPATGAVTGRFALAH